MRVFFLNIQHAVLIPVIGLTTFKKFSNLKAKA